MSKNVRRFESEDMEAGEYLEGCEPLRVGASQSVRFVHRPCRAVRPPAAGAPDVACHKFVPTESRAARPSAVSDLFVGG
jgi:hypothetical protein